jgi:low affinity Fe/Cu permease
MYKAFTSFANNVALLAGRPYTFIICLALILVWALSGPLFGFSDTWQLIVNTTTTIITFLMVFLIQNTQNRESDAMQAKLDTLILASAKADNRYIGIEDLTDQELKDILADAARRAGRARNQSPLDAKAEAARAATAPRKKKAGSKRAAAGS